MRKAPVFALLLAACGSSTPATTDSLSWLEGCWQAELDGTTVAECWERDGDVLRGQGRLDDRIYETTVIGVTNGELQYVVNKTSGGDNTTFTATEVSDTRVRFENPAHDSPKWIAYERSGEQLVGTVGIDSAPTNTFRFERQ